MSEHPEAEKSVKSITDSYPRKFIRNKWRT